MARPQGCHLHIRLVSGALEGNRNCSKDYYDIDEFARLTGKAPFTCREWARLGRIKAEKKGSGRGKFQSWVIPHVELLRYRKEGLLPLIRH